MYLRFKMKRFITLLLLLSVSPFLGATEKTVFQGEFECSGKEVDSEETFKMVMTVAKTGSTYSINSDYEGASYLGTGIYDSANKSLSAVITNPANAKETCLVIFHEKNKNTLEANWTYLGEQRVAPAVCERI